MTKKITPGQFGFAGIPAEISELLDFMLGLTIFDGGLLLLSKKTRGYMDNVLFV